MWAPHQAPEPIEKIKARWTPENTAQTQAVVNRLLEARRCLRACGMRDAEVMYAIEAALKRFQAMDSQIVIPYL